MAGGPLFSSWRCASAMLGSGRSLNGSGPPNSSEKTRSKVVIWLGSETRVASAQTRSSAIEVAFMTVTARARRSHRSGPTGRPAACSAVPRPAASTATSGAAGRGRRR